MKVRYVNDYGIVSQYVGDVTPEQFAEMNRSCEEGYYVPEKDLLFCLDCGLIGHLTGHMGCNGS